MNPEQLKFAKTHEWVSLAGGSHTATLGISAFAVEALTDLVYIELPAVGRKLRPGETFGEIESVKAVSDLYSPVEGEVVEVNTALKDRLELVKDDPYGAGWMIKVKLSGPAGLSALLDYEAYQAQCAEEPH